MPKIDLPELKATTPATSDNRVYVTVPDVDLFDMTYPDITLNGVHYGPGKHYVPADIAGEIEERIRMYNRSCVRLLQPKPDSKAINIISSHGSGKRAGGSFTDPQNEPLFAGV